MLTELLEGPEGGRIREDSTFRTDAQNEMDVAHQRCYYLRPPLELFSSRHTPAAMIQRAREQVAGVKELQLQWPPRTQEAGEGCRKSSCFCHHASDDPRGQDNTLHLPHVTGVLLIGTTEFTSRALAANKAAKQLVASQRLQPEGGCSVSEVTERCRFWI